MNVINYIKVAKIYPGATLPTRKHGTDAGMDLYLYEPSLVSISFDHPVPARMIKSGEVGLLGTGVIIDIPRGYMGLIKPKSRHNFSILAGVVDSGYLGEVMVKVLAEKGGTVIHQGQAFAQMVILPVATPIIQEVSSDHFEETERGSSGGINLVNH